MKKLFLFFLFLSNSSFGQYLFATEPNNEINVNQPPINPNNQNNQIQNEQHGLRKIVAIYCLIFLAAGTMNHYNDEALALDRFGDCALISDKSFLFGCIYTLIGCILFKYL